MTKKEEIELALLYRKRNDLEKEIARVKAAHKQRLKEMNMQKSIHINSLF